jgi:hypothetical protein
LTDITIAIDELFRDTAATDLFIAALKQGIDQVTWPGSDSIVWLERGGLKVAGIVNVTAARGAAKMRGSDVIRGV